MSLPLTRKKRQDHIANRCNLEDVTESLKSMLFDAADTLLNEGSITTARFLRILLSDPDLNEFRELTGRAIAKIARCSEALVAKVRKEVSESKSRVSINPRIGRPHLLSSGDEASVLGWLRDKHENHAWPTLVEFKNHVQDLYGHENPTKMPSHEYYKSLLARLTKGEFSIVDAVPLEAERYEVTKADLTKFAEELEGIEISKVDPRLIINLDESGFGQSRSGRKHKRKVIVPLGFSGTPYYKEESVSHYVTSITAITAAGKLLMPGLITARGSDHPDGEKLPYFAKCARYTSKSAFVNQKIFGSYLRSVVIDYVVKERQKIGNEFDQAVLLMDGHTTHDSDLIRAILAQQRIVLLLIPPHSSHIVQPLDRGFFNSVKAQFANLPALQGFSKISGTLQRVYDALRMSSRERVIWMAWQHAGWNLHVIQGTVSSIEFAVERISDSPAMNHEFVGNQGAQGRPAKRGEWGILNEDEALIRDAGQCPLCFAPVDE